ncbi:hypothetical protein SAMN05216388_1002344 [Halorientalis persicus]|uniref:Uncharacterized protein n=1 Tax=Halorientalis persicus TaxID=1367881 RepID=A0A1H8FQU1_9EURY|nr:hypothetical protein [Halorientalis persicus]SEN33617.1 hypothetical protein SAMN05216388_1002344 [Halorientalis persicus]
MSEEPDTEPSEERTGIERAVRAIRREGYKAAGLHAVVDAVAVFLVVNLLTRVVAAPLPAVGPVRGGTVAAVGVALLAGGVEFAFRVRYYTVERFEAANPVVADALRTARDAATDGAETQMARRLYRDVTDRLSETSAGGFLQTRWLSVSVVVVVLASALTVQAAVAGVTFAPEPNTTDERRGPGSFGGEDNGVSELQNPDDVLGERKEAAGGREELDVNFSQSSGGGAGDQVDSYEDSGLSAGGDPVAAQQAGFAAERNLEDADLVREYNLRVQRDTDD